MDVNAITRNPMLWPFLSLEPGEQLDIGNVPEEAAISDPITGQLQTPQGVTNNLARFRVDFPNVPIIPFPNQVRTVALVQNIAQDIEIPDRVVAIMLRGSSDYFICNQGNAEIPADKYSKSIYKPEGMLLYTGGIQTLSAITNNVGGCILTLMGYAPVEMPRYAG